jgi:hypothetical protein
MADFGSLYWFAARHGAGAYLDVEDSHSLSIPQPMPASLFWSVTVYDPDTRFVIRTDQGKAPLLSLFGLKGKTDPSVDLYFGPTALSGHGGELIKTNPGKGGSPVSDCTAPSSRHLTSPGSQSTLKCSTYEQIPGYCCDPDEAMIYCELQRRIIAAAGRDRRNELSR